MKPCKRCGLDFEPTTKKSIFCSLKCRQADYRKRLIEANRLLQGKMTSDELTEELTESAKAEIIAIPLKEYDSERIEDIQDEPMPEWEKRLLQLRQNKNKKK